MKTSIYFYCIHCVTRVFLTLSCDWHMKCSLSTLLLLNKSLICYNTYSHVIKCDLVASHTVYLLPNCLLHSKHDTCVTSVRVQSCDVRKEWLWHTIPTFIDEFTHHYVTYIILIHVWALHMLTDITFTW